MKATLAAGIRALGLDMDSAAQAALLAYLGLLQKWNRTHNLTAIGDAERMITHHLLDSLAVVPHLPPKPGLRIADVGSGGGLPGIPLAICRPAWRVTLIEASRKKAAFLRQASIELPLSNVEVVGARVENYRPEQPFDVAISRAYSSLANFAHDARHLVSEGGRLFAMKGAYPGEEIEALPLGTKLVDSMALDVPGVDAQRHLVVMKSA
ncbi:MAG TPA: 16S rRNA (guanine(527)-N(7))-methyltransferase RsmG [Casimicrobiaceae bacterium]|nr:16S rRNA (guanine(527)-N(7))-methyltransferase RsmG [Casimicrobiaceae bacterium]